MHTGTLTACQHVHCWCEWTRSLHSDTPCHNTYSLSLFLLDLCQLGFPLFFLGFTAPVGCSSGRSFLSFPYSWPPPRFLPETTRSNFVRPRLKSLSHATIEYCHWVFNRYVLHPVPDQGSKMLCGFVTKQNIWIQHVVMNVKSVYITV